MGGRHRLPGGSGTGIQLASGEYEDNGSEGKAYVILCENGFQEAVNPEAAPIFPQCTVSGLGAPRFPEKGETAAYQIEAEGKRILLLGSMELDPDTVYPENADLLILPYQGKENMAEAAMEIVERLKPARILLDHFDDAFPPYPRR